jgi:hypothetical protein
MKEIWILLAAVAGMGVGVALVKWRDNSKSFASPSPSKSFNPPSKPSPGKPNHWMCPQVLTRCNDSTIASTPCDCQNHGGVKQPKEALV